MYLFNNSFNDIREIKGFTKEEILQMKNKLSELKSDNEALNDFLKTKFQNDILENYDKYTKEIRNFIEQFLLSESDDKYFFNLKSKIQEELDLISKNLANVSDNGRNIKRLLKENKFLSDLLAKTKIILNEAELLSSNLEKHKKKIDKSYEDNIYLWIETNKIKNLNFKLNNIPDKLKMWQEIAEIETYIQSLVEAKTKKKIKLYKEIPLSFHFDELYQFFLAKQEGSNKAFEDLIYLLYIVDIFDVYEVEEEFINVLERKEIIKSLKLKLRPVVISLIEDNLNDYFQEILELEKEFQLFEKEQKEKLDLKKLMERKFNNFLPKLVDLYFNGLDKKFQIIINELDEEKTDEFIDIVYSYYDKIGVFASKFDEIDIWLISLDKLLKPFEVITANLKKTISSLSSEIDRRKNEYLSYLESVRDESLRVEVRKYVNEKISEVNKMISEYEDQTSILIREELPQLKKIRELITEYKGKIENIKEEVYNKLDKYKANNIELFQIIKQWENNFNRKKQQLTFLLTVLLNKVFKSFKDLIDQESILFAEITEITKQTENYEGLPLNFALSAFLAERLSEDELRDRIIELNAKINQLTSSLGLYQVELAKTEEILSNKVKIREGVTLSDVQCTVCHNYINFAKDKVITCPFCGSTYHYLCVAAWLSKYNSCPMCQNHFIEPYSGLFETDE
ncbi:MAG: hypothetical protein ACFFD5_00410 [Candidatus Thorarchaeota archaeon]